LPFDLGGWMLSAAGTMEGSMSKASLDNRHRNKDGEISGKHGNTSSARCVRFTGRVSQLAILKPRSSVTFYLS
jgi:hypothetical protein